MEEITSRLESLENCPYCGGRPTYIWDEPSTFYNSTKHKPTIYMGFKLLCSDCKATTTNTGSSVVLEPQPDGELKIIKDGRLTAEKFWNRRA